MHDFATTRIYPLTEHVFNEIIELAGGRRAHPDHDRRKARNADYILGEAVIELKILEDEGLSKGGRQAKIAALFVAQEPNRPVYVLDREALDLDGQRAYDRAMEGPIKGAVKSAKGQLVQSRAQFPETKTSILMIVNNTNTALDHDEIVALATRRARNDTDDIDGIVVAGAYLHSDGFDTFALWPIDYIPIQLQQAFPEYKSLRKAFYGYAERAMLAAIKQGRSRDMTKGPMLDTGFDHDGKTFIKPAPPLGKSSDFYINGRPRRNSTGINSCPIVGLIFPDLDRTEWEKFRSHMPDDPSLGARFEDWLAEREKASSQGTLLRPMVPMAVTFDGWVASLAGARPPRRFSPIRDYANWLYQETMNEVIKDGHEIDKSSVLPSRFVLAATELIGQDQANDVSHIFLIEEEPKGKPKMTPLVRNARIIRLHAIGLGASYTVKHGVPSLRWKKDMTYAWS